MNTTEHGMNKDLCGNMSSIYNKLSKQRKLEQSQGLAPDWLTTGGYQMLRSKYLDSTETVRDRYSTIAKVAAKHMPEAERDIWAYKFFNILWKGWLAASTPVLSNMGKPHKGMPVSCSGNYVEDSIDGFYEAYAEIATLTKNGFGTSSYLGDVRPRGAKISAGGKASGVLDVVTSIVDDMRKVSQGTSRRGAWAGYYPMSGGDFHELVKLLEMYPDDLNIGWTLSDQDCEDLESGDPEARIRFAKIMKTKMVTGKGYLFFPDKVNRANPPGMEEVKASNLCTEITLPSTEELTFTCVLSSLNLAKYDEWKDTDTVETAVVFLDCVAAEFISLAKGKRNFDKTVRYTEKYRSLGLGTLGYHTYLQKNMIAFDSVDAFLLNNVIFEDIQEKAYAASKFLGEKLGVPEGNTLVNRRNSHLIAVAPNTSSALICGGVSQGIEPVVANVYNQQTAAGDIYRINPIFLELAKERGQFNDALVDDLIFNTDGSVQHLDWLDDHEKRVFRTGYEVHQPSIIRTASDRQRFICQGQSLNLFGAADESEATILEWHKLAILDENIKALYYFRTKAGVKGADCASCEG